MPTIQINLSEEEFQRLEAFSQSEGKTVEQVMREAIIPLITPPVPQHLRREPRIRPLSAATRSRLRQSALQAIIDLHKQLGEPTYPDSSTLIRELRDSDD